MKKDTRSKVFYGYIVVTASFFILIVMHGIFATYGVFFSSLQNGLGLSRAAVSGGHSIAFFLEGLFAIIVGRLTDKFGPRLVMSACGVIFALGYLLTSRVENLWQLYIVYPILVGIGVSAGNVTLLSTVTRWFARRRGLMTGIIKAGTGAGIFILPVVASWLITTYDWRTAYVVLSVIGLVGIVATAQFLKRDPAQMGLQPHGMYDANGNVSDSNESVQLSLGEAMHTYQFWAACAAYFIIWYTTQSIMVHIVTYGTDGGISVTQASSIMSVLGAVSIAGRLAMGSAGDRLGNRRALIICFIILLVSMAWLQVAKGLLMLLIFAVVYGFAHGGFFALMSPLVAELFGTKSHGVNFGMLLFIAGIGGGVGPAVTGYIFDVTHSYQLAFFILMIVTAGALLLSIMKIKPVKVS